MKPIKRCTLFSLLFFAFALFSLPAFAQENEDSKKRALLPDIKSQNIKIRGEFEARFPGLERQPILGFDPTMRIYQFPSGRTPYMETGREAVADLTISHFSRPGAPAYTPLQYNNVHYMFARLGYGSFRSPVLEFWGWLPINEKAYLGLDINYKGSAEGHIAHRPSSYRYLTVNAEFGTQLNENLDLYVYAGIQNDFNYAAHFGPQESGDNIARIEYEGLHAGFTLAGYKNAIRGWKLQGEIRSFTSSYKSKFMPGKIEEKVFSGSFSYRWPLARPGATLKAFAGGRAGVYETPKAGGRSWSTVYAGLAYERLFNYHTRLHAEGSLYYISNFAESGVYPGIEISLSQWLGSRLKITARVEAKPMLQTVEEYHEQNRFLGYNHGLRHTYAIRINGEASLEWYRGSKLYGGITYLNASNYSYFTPQIKRDPAGPGELHFYTVNYGEVTNMKIYAGIIHQLIPETFWLNAQLYIQNPQLTSTDQPVPYSENWGINASATYRPGDRITIKAWAKYLGDREPGPASTEFEKSLLSSELDNILLIGAQIDVRIVEGVGAYLKVVNLLDQEYQYWQGYIERPLQLFGGITFTF